jgi:hypothetical protein
VIIPRTVRLSEAPGFGQPITIYDPKSKGAECYRLLAKEVASKPPPSEPMPSFDALPTVVIPAVADSPIPASPAPDEVFEEVPTVHEVVEEFEEELAEQLEPIEHEPSGPTAASLMEHPESEPQEAAAWLGELSADADAAASPTTSEVLAEVAAEIDLDEAVWDSEPVATAPEPEPPAVPAAMPVEPPIPSRVVVIDDATADRLQEAASNPPQRVSDAAEEPQPVARIGATLENEGRQKKRWRLFRRGGD